MIPADDVIETRHLQDRIEEIETEYPQLAEDYEPEEGDSFPEPDEDDVKELKHLRALRDEIGSEWKDGVVLIRDDHFETYARELAEDIGAIRDDAAWPYTCIDWERAARDLQTDYSSIEVDGVDYWYRS